MGMKAPSLASIMTAVIFALSVFGFTLFVWKAFGGSIPFEAKGYQVHVPFDADAVQLASNADVRISGVNVGKVKSVTPRGGKLDTVIEIDRDFAPIPADTKAVTRAKTLLGETFIELTPGSRGARDLPEGGTLAVEQVEETQGLDEVLSAFDPETRQEFKVFLRGFAEGVKGRGRDLNAALGNLGPAAGDLETLVELLDAQRDDVRGLVRDTGTALQAVARRDGALRSMVESGNEVFGSTARRDRELVRTVNALPPFLRELRGTLTAVDSVTDDAAPLLRELRPAAPLLRPALEGAEELLPQFVPVASELDPVIDAAQEGLPALTRILNAAGPLVDVLDPATREVLPVAKVLDTFKQLAVNGVALGGAALQAHTDEQHYLRTLLPFWNELLVGAESRFGTNRHNPYYEPGALAKLAEGPLEAFDCKNVDNPTPVPPLGSGTPECREQGPWEFDGVSRQFPRVERAP